jgi:hypothetical protein
VRSTAVVSTPSQHPAFEVKIRVQRGDGRIETLALRAECTIRAYDGQHMNYLSIEAKSISIMDHYFTHDGHYDGWGGGAVCGTMDEAKEVIDSMESKREIESAPAKPEGTPRYRDHGNGLETHTDGEWITFASAEALFKRNAHMEAALQQIAAIENPQCQETPRIARKGLTWGRETAPKPEGTP